MARKRKKKAGLWKRIKRQIYFRTFLGLFTLVVLLFWSLSFHAIIRGLVMNEIVFFIITTLILVLLVTFQVLSWKKLKKKILS